MTHNPSMCCCGGEKHPFLDYCSKCLTGYGHSELCANCQGPGPIGKYYCNPCAVGTEGHRSRKKWPAKPPPGRLCLTEWRLWRDQVCGILATSLPHLPPWIDMFQRGLTPSQAVIAATEFSTI